MTDPTQISPTMVAREMLTVALLMEVTGVGTIDVTDEAFDLSLEDFRESVAAPCIASLAQGKQPSPPPQRNWHAGESPVGSLMGCDVYCAPHPTIEGELRLYVSVWPIQPLAA